MQSKYYKKVYLFTFLVISFVFAQTLDRKNNFVKLSDGRIIEVNDQIMEDYFFFEVDSPEASKQESEFDSEFENNYNDLSQTQPASGPTSPSDDNATSEFIDSDSPRNLNESDTQAFDLNKPPQQYYKPQGVLKPILPIDQGNRALNDQLNSVNNNINLNLYNLTNLLDQIFSKGQQNIQKDEIRTGAWENAYREILNQEALGIVQNDLSLSNQNNNATLRDFIIKLPLLYDLIYGDKQIRPREKSASTQPTDSQFDKEGYYQKSVDLLTNILRSFPDINDRFVNVIIITNINSISTEKEKDSPKKERDPNYYNDVDPKYQREFEGMRKKYNYNIGLELVQIKKLFVQKKYSLVLKKLHQLEKIEPYNIRIKNIIGSTYYKIGFYEFAQEYWEESLRLNPNQPLVEVYLDRILEYAENTDGDIGETLGNPSN